MLRRRALADGTVLLVETTLIACTATAVTQVRFNEFNYPYLPSPGLALLWSLVAGAAWAALAGFVLKSVRSYLTQYVSSILVETGLLYLAIEHDPHDRLHSLGGLPALPQNPAKGKAALSFKRRMFGLVTRYAACAHSLGFRPYPSAWRLALIALVATVLGMGALFIYLVVEGVNDAFMGLGFKSSALKPFGIALVWLILGIFIVDHPRRSAPKIALADILVGEDEAGRAVLARR